MKAKKLLMEQVDREREYLLSLEVGGEDYTKSLYRLMDLEKQLAELEKDRISHILDGIKTGSGVVLPLIGLVWISAVEKDTTFTGALKEYTRYFLPKK